MLVGLADAYSYVDETDDVRAAVLTGAGGAFSSGMDLVSMNQPRSEYVEKRMSEEPNLHWKGLLRDYRCSKPMIAAVEGYAVAGGTEMLQGTDIRIAGEGAIFGVWEARARALPARRLGVPAAASDPVHGRHGHPAVGASRERARSAADRPHRPGRARRPGAQRGAWRRRSRSPSAGRCPPRRSSGRGARPSTSPTPTRCSTRTRSAGRSSPARTPRKGRRRSPRSGRRSSRGGERRDRARRTGIAARAPRRGDASDSSTRCCAPT